MSQIVISLEGANAIAFAEALKGIKGYEVNCEVPLDPDETLMSGEKLDRVLATLTAIVALGSGLVGLASDSMDLYDQIRQLQSQPIELVVLESSTGLSVTLENATPEQIAKAIQDMQQSGQ
jgi:hypothetical protein